jgi:hypothetical protein
MRKTFYLNNDNDFPVMAAGVIIYKVKKNVVSILLSKNKNVYEDLGGRVDLDDDTIFDTVIREVYEETNKKNCNQKKIKNIKKSKKFY